MLLIQLILSHGTGEKAYLTEITFSTSSTNISDYLKCLWARYKEIYFELHRDYDEIFSLDPKYWLCAITREFDYKFLARNIRYLQTVAKNVFRRAPIFFYHKCVIIPRFNMSCIWVLIETSVLIYLNVRYFVNGILQFSCCDWSCMWSTLCKYPWIPQTLFFFKCDDTKASHHRLAETFPIFNSIFSLIFSVIQQ